MHKGELRRQAILDAGEKLFFEKGYAGTTIQDFLDELNCSKGSFYHHFESKLQVLTALCRQRAEESYREFGQQVYDQALDRLNGLVYYAMPFRSGEEKTVALLLPLQGLSDGKMVQQAVIDARKELFFPEMLRLTEFLREKGEFHYRQVMLPELLWDSFAACFQRLMQEAVEIKNGGPTAGVVQIIEAERFLWERLLDAPFASLELIRADEALQTIGHAISRIRRMETGQEA
ncbi:MAG: TetR/AcrR family transcriptional regulator [Clostridiales bacterium]|nr:TetR/AcrR family transcriptional regulator [Clostridiales bacterium]